jgi:hypothetical protein
VKISFRLLPHLAVFLLGSSPLFAGNIVLTGHDDDFHQSVNALGQISAFAKYAANGSSLPFLVFDAGNELTSGLTAAGISNFVNVDPSVGSNITDALFSTSKYSAFMIASDESCGGCDNNGVTSANINAHALAIAGFLNGGAGIVAFAGADNAGYYSFLPQTASSVGGAPSEGYSQTSVGATLGIPAVNGDATHNLFNSPGTGGTSSAYQVAEINSFGNGTILGPDAATTLVCTGCTTSGGVIIGGGTSDTPEPGSVLLLTCGLGGVTFYLRRKRVA